MSDGVSGFRLTRRGRFVLQILPSITILVVGMNVVSRRWHEAEVRPLAGAPRPSSVPASASPGVTPKASPKTTPKASPKATPTRRAATVAAGTGVLQVVPGRSAVHGTGAIRRFIVEVERGLSDDPVAFAATVQGVLFDARGWRGGGLAFQRVDSGPVAFRVTLASPATVDRLCRPLRTGGIYSCWNGARAVLNVTRWRQGAQSYAGDLPGYRTYMVNHEVGHALGHGHRTTCGAGGLAPVMMQQTKSRHGCRRNVWPLVDER